MPGQRRGRAGPAARAGRLSAAYQPSRLGSIEELPLALGFALTNSGAFRASIEDGINSGRDTDSIGVMAGAILGALHGESVIVDADRQTLDSANRLDLTAAADRFTSTATDILLADRQTREAAERSRDSLFEEGPLTRPSADLSPKGEVV